MVRALRLCVCGTLLGLALALAAPRAAEANCTCSVPGDSLCPANCDTCTFTTDCCQCDTTCALFAPACLSGYTTVSTTTCSLFTSRNTCQRCASHQTSNCASCAPGYFGTSCAACPGGAANPCNSANGGGTCDQGIRGSGACTCSTGFKGSFCQYSDATTCSGHGTVDFYGSCTCAAGYAGAACDQCAANLTGYPDCATICGDVNDDGNVDAADVESYRFYLADPEGSAFTPAGASKCTVVPLVPALPPCDVLDLVVIRRSIQTPALLPGRAPACAAVTP